ncbi:hypothetical protein LguiA_027737 [Lonicera macranthoides]
MEDCLRKLALWNTRTFKPIITHHELEPIMATLGFIAVPWFPPNIESTTTSWKKYLYSNGGCRSQSPAPRPRLPYPRIDGLHSSTYHAFLDAVNFYLHMNDLSDLFHIRGMPLHKVHDRGNKWQMMKRDGSNIFVYRKGTLDQATCNFYSINTNNNNNDDNCNEGRNSIIIRNKGRNTATTCIVPLKDVIPVDHNLWDIR